MSDKGSQHGSIRAGYRRSRMEPVDPNTITAPPNAPSPNGQTRPPSTGPKKEDEQKEGMFKKILRFTFLFLNIVFMAFAIMMITMGVILWIVLRDEGVSISDVADGAPLILIINGIMLMIFAVWGCEIAMVSGSRKTTIMYLISLVMMFGFSIFTYTRAHRLSDSVKDNLNQYWGTYSSNTRSMIQDFGYCCGLHGPIDYPALPCPDDATKGCYEAFSDMQSSISSASTGCLIGSVFTFLSVAGMAAYLGFSKPEDKPSDEESNKTEPEVAKKEEGVKVEAPSPI